MTNTHTVTVSQVMHPTTGEVVAIEIVDNTGRTWFVAPPGDFFDGLRGNAYPTDENGFPLKRVEKMRMQL